MYGFYIPIIVHAIGAVMVELKRNPQTAVQVRNWLQQHAVLANVLSEVRLFFAMMSPLAATAADPAAADKGGAA